ncbi:MAG: hypothetical protein WC596_02950 [Candidatus Shapirobacteria bacterium]
MDIINKIDIVFNREESEGWREKREKQKRAIRLTKIMLTKITFDKFRNRLGES